MREQMLRRLHDMEFSITLHLALHSLTAASHDNDEPSPQSTTKPAPENFCGVRCCDLFISSLRFFTIISLLRNYLFVFSKSSLSQTDASLLGGNFPRKASHPHSDARHPQKPSGR
jgi:hypothetical protein